MENLLQILQIAVNDGFVWFPFVLGVGLLYNYSKTIDVGIDGATVLAGIACGSIWNLTHSYIWSLSGAIISSGLYYALVSITITKFRVNAILAGILFTLVAHSLSVILIGESLVLDDTKLFENFMKFSVVPVVFALVAGVLSFLFFKTNLGMAVRLGANVLVPNSGYGSRVTQLAGFSVSGILVGMGTFVYTHQQGVARAGGGFDFLVTSLSSFLVVDRILSLLLRLVAPKNEKRSSNHQRVRVLRGISTTLSSPFTKAFVGSIFFQILVLFVISKVPNPAYWKLLFGAVLIASVIKPTLRGNRHAYNTSNGSTPPGVLLENVSLGYDLEYQTLNVFEGLTVTFGPGVNYIWGPNGSGKSTILGSIFGLIPIHDGRIVLNQRDVTLAPSHERKAFFLTQNPFNTVAADLTVYENLIASLHRHRMFGLTTHGYIRQELNRRLKQVDLPGLTDEEERQLDKRSGDLSGGQAQTLAIYMALLSDSEVLLADEPSSGLDTLNLDRLAKVLDKLGSNGRILVVATHDNRLMNMSGEHYDIFNGSVIRRVNK